MTRKQMRRGDKFRRDVLATHDLSVAELVLLEEIGSVLDEIDSLPDDAIIERRLQRQTLNRLLGSLNLPDDSGLPQVLSPMSARGKRAAEARWRKARA